LNEKLQPLPETTLVWIMASGRRTNFNLDYSVQAHYIRAHAHPTSNPGCGQQKCGRHDATSGPLRHVL